MVNKNYTPKNAYLNGGKSGSFSRYQRFSHVIEQANYARCNLFYGFACFTENRISFFYYI